MKWVSLKISILSNGVMLSNYDNQSQPKDLLTMIQTLGGVAYRVPSADGLTDSLERRHKGRAFIQHGQNRVSGLGRKHQDDPINAGITVAF
jgi:hypothetical protein